MAKETEKSLKWPVVRLVTGVTLLLGGGIGAASEMQAESSGRLKVADTHELLARWLFATGDLLIIAAGATVCGNMERKSLGR